jgi:hypothetical protein
MKVKGLVNKIYRLNSNSINFNVKKLDELKQGKTVELAKEDANDLVKRGMAQITSSKKGDK